MPRYAHYCPDCNKVFEAVRPMAEVEKKEPCPKCGKPCPHLISAPAIHWRNTPKFH